jgi:MICOS complex subunit MIC12
MLLNSAVEPLPPLPETPAYEVRRTSLTEELKDRWNGEIEHAVRRLQTTDWDAVRVRWERRIGNVFQRLRESDAGKEVAAAGDTLKENVIGATEGGAKDAAKEKTAKKTTGKRLLEQ